MCACYREENVSNCLNTAEMAVLLVGSQSIQDKVTARLKCRHAVFNEKWIHEDGQALITSKRWMRKLKTHMLDI